MKAVILVGGEATRMRPLTCNIPKAMVPVLNTPFLEHVIRHLSGHGIKDIILAQHHMAESMERYFGDGSQFGVRLTCVMEDSPRGTAGAIKNVEQYLDDTFLALNGDIFNDLDFTAMIGFHRSRRAKVTIALTPVDDPTIYGLIETDDEGRVKRFLEKPSRHEITTNMINAGTYVLEPEILAQIPPQTKVSIERETFPFLVGGGKAVYAYPTSGYWMDTGTPEKYLQLHRDLLGGKSEHYALASDRKVLIGEGSDVHPTAQIKAPVVIGDNCSIGPGVKLNGPVVIGANCAILEDSILEDSVIWWDVQLGPRIMLKTSAVASNCRVGADCVLEEVVLGDNVTVVGGSKLEPGSKIWPGETVGKI